MRGLIALFLLSLPLAVSAQADQRAYRKAADEWIALFRPLATARVSTAGPVFDRILRESEGKNEAVLTHIDGVEFFSTWEKDRMEVWAIFDGLYARATPKERRTLLRFYAAAGDLFGELDVPQYPTCGTGLNELFKHNARTLFEQAVKKEPAAHLGLLDDPDPRVAELTAEALREAYPDEVRTHLLTWSRSRHARFRGIAATWTGYVEDMIPFLGEETRQRMALELLDDPSEDVRETVIDALREETAAKAYHARVPGFAKASEPRRCATIVLGTRHDFPGVKALALQSLTGGEGLLKAALRAPIWESVPPSALLRLFRHPSAEVRRLAYNMAADRGLPFADVKEGIADPVPEVAKAAFETACRLTKTRAEFAYLIGQYRQRGFDDGLHHPAIGLGEEAVPEIVALLTDVSPAVRTQGIGLSSGNMSKALLSVLRRMVDDPAREVRYRLIYGAASWPKDTARDLLTLFIKDPDARNRDLALKKLAALDARDE